MMMIESEAEFKERHGLESVRINEGRVQLFADGARIEHRDYYGSTMFEPPEGPKANLEARRLFQETKARIFEEAFTGLRQALLGEIPIPWQWDNRLGPPPNGVDGKTVLLDLKSKVHQYREAIAALNAEIEALPEVIAAREKAALLAGMDQESRRRQEWEFMEIRQIEL